MQREKSPVPKSRRLSPRKRSTLVLTTYAMTPHRMMGASGFLLAAAEADAHR